MGKERPFLSTLNGGEVSPLSLGRIDLARMRFTADTMRNFMPLVIGPMRLRAGLGYQASVLNDAVARHIPCVFAANDTALAEITNTAFRPVLDGTPLTRTAVGTTITNGDFSSAVGWTTVVTSSGTATISGGLLTFELPTRGGTALVKRQVTVAGADQNKEHGLRIVITRGPVTFRCGSTDGGDEYIRETDLNTGTYSLALTPTGNFWVQFASRKDEAERIVDSITVEAAGPVQITAPWLTADLPYLRWIQSGDVIFITNTTQTYQPMKIERRSARSWGLTKYEFFDGPFRGKTAQVRLSNTARTGMTTMTASAPFFRTSHVGAIFELTHKSTSVSDALGANDTYSDPIRVSGINDGTQRRIAYTVSGGAWTGTLTLQYSYDDGLTWVPQLTVTGVSANASHLVVGDNVPVMVRWGFIGADYGSGVVTVTLAYKGGGGAGCARVVSFTSSTSVRCEVLKRFHDDISTSDWVEGRHSDVWGWPTAVEIYDGRLWFLDKDQLAGSVSDDFVSFDLEVDGDSGPIIRSIATGPVNKGLWLLGLARLIMGTVGAEPVARSSSFDEPMTPTNFSIKDASTQGSADVAAVKIDRSGIFVQRSGKRVYLVSFSVEDGDYSSQDISRYNQTILDAGVVGVAVQRQPDTRIWFWLSDGTAAVLVLERAEDVVSWCRFTTDGLIEDITVLPNTEADDVYMVVNRTIGGTKRYRELLAYDTEAEGGVDNYMADSFVTADLVATATMPGLTHLVGESVVAWVNGAPVLDAAGDPATFVVDVGGNITLPAVYTGKAIAGLAYDGLWISTKLAYGAQMGTAVSQPKQIKDFAAVLYKTHLRAMKYGVDVGHLGYMSREVGGKIVPFDTFLDTYDARPLPIDGGAWNTDSRIVIAGRAPLPLTVIGLAGAVVTHEVG